MRNVCIVVRKRGTETQDRLFFCVKSDFLLHVELFTIFILFCILYFHKEVVSVCTVILLGAKYCIRIWSKSFYHICIPLQCMGDTLFFGDICPGIASQYTTFYLAMVGVKAKMWQFFPVVLVIFSCFICFYRFDTIYLLVRLALSIGSLISKIYIKILSLFYGYGCRYRSMFKQKCAVHVSMFTKANVQLRATLRNVQNETVMDIMEHIQHVQLLVNVS